MSVPIRVRHPKGVSTIQVDLNSDSPTVLSLQQSIYELSGLLPSQQELKTGYPPKALALVPELPLSSLGLQRGDQITVTLNTNSATPTSSARPPAPASTPRTQPASTPTSAPKATPGSDGFVETPAGTLVHRQQPEKCELVEIDSYDVETGRCDKFGEGKYENRCILMYSGIHYDAVSLAPTPDAPLDFHTTVFPIEGSEHISQAAAKLTSQLRASRKFTNTSTFDLKCEG
ncbi:ubiquitin-specific protease otu1 [Ceratobasidium sp. 392]|nr:ubiquitin-specific protease otu1 [Ceratobasidium sp. 392]